MFPVVMVVANLATVGVMWFGGHRVESGQMEVGALTAYISYLMQIVMSVMMAMFMLMMVPRAAVCADRITEVLDVTRGDFRTTQRFGRLRSANVLRFYDDNREDLGGQAACLIAP